MSSLLVILVGKAGVGKTAIRTPLAQALKARGIGPDDHPYRWDWAVRQLDSSPRVVLECCQIPRAVRARMDADTVVVELRATDEVRRKRLFRQGHDTEEVERRMAASSDTLGWEGNVQATMTLDVSDLDPDQAAERITRYEEENHARSTR